MYYLTSRISDFAENFYSDILNNLDVATKEYILKKKKTEAQKTSLLALYLLKNGLSEFYGIGSYKILRTEKGKPYLEDNKVYFSISHTKGIAAVAFSEHPIGIDIEYTRKYSAVAERMFDDIERKYALQSDLNFTKIWTLKEAAVKATGQGIADAKNISFRLSPEKITASIPDAEMFQTVNNGLVISICEIK